MVELLVRIEPVARAYAWGSPSAIPALLGTVPTGEPLAELWFGAHPDSPSTTADGPLDRVIAADPAGLLGADAARFGDRLPFLMKLLAAKHPLSIQVHPNLEQAQAGFADEQVRGIAPTAPDRNYRDPYAKPELLVALTEFDALCGFRPIAETIGLLRALDVPALEPVLAALSGPEPFRVAFEWLLNLAAPERDQLLASIESASRRLVDAAGAPASWQLAGRAFLRCAEDFPGEIGPALSLLLNAMQLQPGEAIFLRPGNVHAYLGGLAVEIMANSDNVLRCGLTPKHVDVPEVLRVADFSVLTQPRIQPVRGLGRSTFAVPVPDFELSILTVPDAVDASVAGPQIILCTEGEVGVAEIVLTPGQAVFAAAGRSIRLSGAGTVFRATTGSAASAGESASATSAGGIGSA